MMMMMTIMLMPMIICRAGDISQMERKKMYAHSEAVKGALGSHP